jgi:selenocysteine-specific elongation factor
VARLVLSRALLEGSTGSERRLFARSHLERAKAALLRALGEFHQAHAAASGATAAELAGRLPLALRPLAAPALEALALAGLVSGGDRVRLPGHDARSMYEQVAEAYRLAGLAPGSDDATRESLELDARTFRDIVGALERDGSLARLATGLHFHAGALGDLRARVLAYFDERETLSPGDFKTLTGLTRKHAIVLLEWLDKQGVTRRQVDLRVKR